MDWFHFILLFRCGGYRDGFRYISRRLSYRGCPNPSNPSPGDLTDLVTGLTGSGNPYKGPL
jgi:hypothetical protein